MQQATDDEDIPRHVDELESAINQDGAESLIYCENPEEQDCELIGNRAGYLRAGIEMLKATLVPLRPGGSITPVSLDYLIRNDRSLRVTWSTRQEGDIEAALPPVKGRAWKDKVIGIGCLAVFVFLLICTLIGLGMVSKQIFGK